MTNTTPLKQVIEAAAREALKLGRDYVGEKATKTATVDDTQVNELQAPTKADTWLSKFEAQFDKAIGSLPEATRKADIARQIYATTRAYQAQMSELLAQLDTKTEKTNDGHTQPDAAEPA